VNITINGQTFESTLKGPCSRCGEWRPFITTVYRVNLQDRHTGQIYKNLCSGKLGCLKDVLDGKPEEVLDYVPRDHMLMGYVPPWLRTVGPPMTIGQMLNGKG